MEDKDDVEKLFKFFDYGIKDGNLEIIYSSISKQLAPPEWIASKTISYGEYTKLIIYDVDENVRLSVDASESEIILNVNRNEKMDFRLSFAQKVMSGVGGCHHGSSCNHGKS